MAKKKEVSEKDKRAQFKSKRISSEDPSVVVTRAYKPDSKKKKKEKASVSRKQKESKSVSFSAPKEDKKRNKIVVEHIGRPRKRKSEKILFLAILMLILLILAVLVFYLYDYSENGGRALETNENIESAIVRENVLYIDLFETDFSSIEKIRFIFLGNQEYILETYEISEFYEIYPGEIGLVNFDSIEKVSAVYEYTPSVNDTVTPAPLTNQTTNQTPGGGGGGGGGGGTCTSTCASLGYECGRWTICGTLRNCGGCGTGDECVSGKCEEICEDECDSEGLFCQGNMPYNCTEKSDGCFDRTNLTACGTGEQCVAGICRLIPDCTTDSDCISFTNVCSIGMCNASGKCQISYNSTTDLCRASVRECDIAEYCNGESEVCPADSFQPDGTACPTGVCSEGVCVECIENGNCNDWINCTADICNLLTNVCDYNPDDSLCLDGNWCNGAETCDALLGCQSGTSPDCSDGVTCTDDSCNPLTGCENNANDSNCFPSEYCNSTSGCQLLVLTCDGTDLSCGIYPDCNNCNNLDGCNPESKYLDYYCNSSACDFLDITAEESYANGNCLDEIDNDCDGYIDRLDANCTAPFPADYVAYWKLDEILEELHITPEETGNHNATFHWAPRIINDTIRGNVAAFDAVQAHLEVEENEELHPPVFAYSAWIKRAINDSTEDYIISNGFDRNFYVGNHNLVFQSGPASLASDVLIEADRWYHVAFTYDGRHARLYLNGLLDKSDDMSISLGGSPNFNIAKCSFNHPDHLFNGSIDDVMVYNRSLSELEIKQIYDVQNTTGPQKWEVASLSFMDKVRNLFRDLFDFLS